MSSAEIRARKAIASLREALATRGVRGLTNLRAHFNSMDVDGSGALIELMIRNSHG